MGQDPRAVLSPPAASTAPPPPGHPAQPQSLPTPLLATDRSTHNTFATGSTSSNSSSSSSSNPSGSGASSSSSVPTPPSMNNHAQPSSSLGAGPSSSSSSSGDTRQGGDNPNGKEPEKKKKRLTQACDHCRRKKIRCDGIRPSCKNCLRQSMLCTYMPSNRKRGRNVPKGPADRSYSTLGYSSGINNLPYGRPNGISGIHSQRPNSTQRPTIPAALSSSSIPSLHMKVDPGFGQHREELQLDPAKAANMQNFTGSYYLPFNTFQLQSMPILPPNLGAPSSFNQTNNARNTASAGTSSSSSGNSGGGTISNSMQPPNPGGHASTINANVNSSSSTSTLAGKMQQQRQISHSSQVAHNQFGIQQNHQHDHAKLVARSISNLFGSPNGAVDQSSSQVTIPNLPIFPLPTQQPAQSGEHGGSSSSSTQPPKQDGPQPFISDLIASQPPQVMMSKSECTNTPMHNENPNSNFNPDEGCLSPAARMQRLRSQFERILDTMWPHTYASAEPASGQSSSSSSSSSSTLSSTTKHGDNRDDSCTPGQLGPHHGPFSPQSILEIENDAQTHMSLSPTHIDIPCNTVTDHLVVTFFEYIHPVFPIIHRPTFARAYRQKRISPLLINAMCASASLFVNRLEDERERLYREHSKLVQDCYHEATFSPTLEVVQASLLMVLCESRKGNYRKAWVYTSMSFRLAMQLGYHRIDGDHGDVMTTTDAASACMYETKRRTFWMSYLLDRYTCIVNGHPMGIDDVDIRLRLPVSEEDWSKVYSPSSRPEVFRVLYNGSGGGGSSSRNGYSSENLLGLPSNNVHSHTIKLVSILAQITHNAARNNSSILAPADPGSPDPNFATFDNALREWKEQLPSQLSYSECKSHTGQPHHTVLLASMHAIYFSAVIHLNRQNMRHLSGGVGQYDTSTGLAIRSIERCRVAAMEIVGLSHHLDSFPLAYSHPLLPWALFQAGTILIHYMIAGNTPMQQEDAKVSIMTLSCALRDGLGQHWRISLKYHVVLSGMVQEWERALASSGSVSESQLNSPAAHVTSQASDTSKMMGGGGDSYTTTGGTAMPLPQSTSSAPFMTTAVLAAAGNEGVNCCNNGNVGPQFNPLAALFNQLSREQHHQQRQQQQYHNNQYCEGSAVASGRFYTMQSTSFDVNGIISPTEPKTSVHTHSPSVTSQAAWSASATANLNSSATHISQSASTGFTGNGSGSGGGGSGRNSDDNNNNNGSGSTKCGKSPDVSSSGTAMRQQASQSFDLSHISGGSNIFSPDGIATHVIDPMLISQMGTFINELQLLASSQSNGTSSLLQFSTPKSLDSHHQQPQPQQHMGHPQATIDQSPMEQSNVGSNGNNLNDRSNS